jgi:bifunctional DNA-binding transcriptional regulator/antitoxin component of YhaV-PrlF toxin-antitoxin module
MMATVRVGDDGRVVVPPEIGEACGIVPGAEVLFFKTGPHTFECRVVQRRSLVEFTARHASYEPHPDLEEILEGIGDEAVQPFLARPNRVAR